MLARKKILTQEESFLHAAVVLKMIIQIAFYCVKSAVSSLATILAPNLLHSGFSPLVLVVM